MAAPAATAPGGPSLTFRGRAYPILLPKLRDPRLHLAAVIFSLQILGQVAFDFRVSIAQILISLATCAVLEVGIAAWRQHVLLWPASALITGNGVSFILRVPGTQHGDWWSMHGWRIYAGTAAVSLLSKHLIQVRGGHIFNPSNFGLVLCFLVLPRTMAEPLDFWWGPMSPWLALAFAIIVGGAVAILTRLKLLGIAVGFWIAFAAGIGVLAATGHAMSARWHLGPITGAYFWWTLVTSPEILVFLFFMITDPRTTPRGQRARVVYAVCVGLLAALLIAPVRTEYATKVAVLSSLAVVCAVRPFLARIPVPRLERRRRVLVSAAALALYVGALVGGGVAWRAPTTASAASVSGPLPAIAILPSKGVDDVLGPRASRQIAADLVADLRLQRVALSRRGFGALQRTSTGDELGALTRQVRAASGRTIEVPEYRLDRLRVHLEAGHGQGPVVAVGALDGTTQLTAYRDVPPVVVRRDEPKQLRETLELEQHDGRWLVARVRSGRPVPLIPITHTVTRRFDGVRLTDVAAQVGLDFRQDDFARGMSNDVHGMMGGGLCWLDYNGDGRLDLFAVNSYTDANVESWKARGGLPRSALFENVHGRFVDVSARTRANVAVQGNGCVAADLNGDGHTDLVVTTNDYNVLLWNNGNGTFVDGTHAAGIDAFGTFGWHTGASVADVNGDGRPDVFVSGYADVNAPTKSSGGFPLNFQAYRDLLYLNEGLDAQGHSRFRDVSRRAGIERTHVDHGLGAVFTDVNGDERPDLYVANDLDPNRLYVNVPGGKLGFHFVEQGRARAVADPNAGMGIAAQDYSGDGRPDVFVTNNRGQGHAAFRSTTRSAFADAHDVIGPALGATGAGWGASWIDLGNNGREDLVLANGAIPVVHLDKDAAPIQVLENLGGGRFADASAALGLSSAPRVNGRGLAAADYDNDGRVDVAINSIGGKLILLHNTGASGQHWLEVSLTKFAPGAVVTAILPDGRRLVRQLQAGSSYLSSEDPRAHFGLGKATRVKELVVRWPSGKVTRRTNVAADQILSIDN
ncbi:MAG: FG-GAP-like repeat-containing protein [Gaiellaceae bacterium]